MLLEMLKAKLHNLTVTHANLNYEGSIGLDRKWLELSGIRPFEKVQVYNITNGERFETYVIEEPEGSGRVVLNGAAARRAVPGDRIIVACYCLLTPEEASSFTPRILIFSEGNRLAQQR